MWAVVTIPVREAMADTLVAALGEPAIKVRDGTGGLQRNHIRAWREVSAFVRLRVGERPQVAERS